jgi:hypothetical protein
MDKSMINNVGNNLKNSLLQDNPNANIEMSERIVSLGTGAFLALKGGSNLFSHPFIALLELAIGGSLLYRAITGYSFVKEMIENQNMTAAPEAEAVVITTSTTSGMGATVPVTASDLTGSTGSTVGSGGSAGSAGTTGAGSMGNTSASGGNTSGTGSTGGTDLSGI